MYYLSYFSLYDGRNKLHKTYKKFKFNKILGMHLQPLFKSLISCKHQMLAVTCQRQVLSPYSLKLVGMVRSGDFKHRLIILQTVLLGTNTTTPVNYDRKLFYVIGHRML
jgi:hypothetical protein